MLGQDQLARTRFPVGHLTKAGVRAEAARRGLRTAAKPDSQEVCFITATGGRRTFLGDRIPLHPGVVVDRAGRRVGSVDAVELVTVGQRKGLGLPGGGPARYALDVDVAARVVTVGEAHELLVDGVVLDEPAWVSAPPEPGAAVLAQCSAHGDPRAARWDGSVVWWEQPQRTVARGQSIVLYDLSDDEVLGGGVAGPAVSRP
jgi:tRNA-specific 2-thiouridylase